MRTVNLKKEVLERITEIDDVEVLTALKAILDNIEAEDFINLTEEQEEELLKASEDVKKGKFFTEEEMKRRVESWLKEK